MLETTTITIFLTEMFFFHRKKGFFEDCDYFYYTRKENTKEH